MASVDKMLTAAAHLSLEIGQDAAQEVLARSMALEREARELHGAIINTWKKQLEAGKPLSAGTQALIKKALK
jgi:hypothetical protein